MGSLGLIVSASGFFLSCVASFSQSFYGWLSGMLIGWSGISMIIISNKLSNKLGGESHE